MYPRRFMSILDYTEALSGMRRPSQCVGWKKIAFGAYNLIVFVFNFLIYPPCELYAFTAIYNDLKALMEHLGITILQLLTLFKVATIALSRKKIDCLIRKLHNLRFQYEDCDEFRPGEYIMKWKKAFDIFCLGSGLSALLVPIGRQTVALYVLFKSADIVESKKTGCFEVLPFYSKFPFETNSMPRCLLAFFIQNSTIVFATFQIIFTDLMVLGLALHVSLHFINLGRAFAKIRLRCIARLKSPYGRASLQNEITRELRQLTLNLQHLISYVQTMEELFSFAFLLQLLSTLYVVVTCLYVINTSDITDPAFLQQGVFLGVNIIEISILCAISNKITDAVSSISDDIYASEWVLFTKADKMTLLMSLIRLRRPVYLTAYKFTPLTLTTFVQVLKCSYSYYTVLSSRN